jgi:hypothetical protein
MRTVDIVRNFISQQPTLLNAEYAIQVLPRNIRMLPIINVDTANDELLHQIYNHFWAYAIVERGVLAPYLFDFRGQTPLRFNGDIYIPDDPADDPDTRPPDWEAVDKNYDYVWAYNTDYYTRDLLAFGTEVYHSGRLRLFRLHNSAK